MALLNPKKLKEKLENQNRQIENKPIVMIVDDEEANLDVLQRCLWDKYDVKKFTDPVDALRYVEGAPEDKLPVVVITDYRMPEMSGVEFLRNLLKLNEDAVRIMLSGRADIGAVIEAVNIGRIYQYISKPFEREHMRLIVDRAAERFDLEKRHDALVNQLERSNDDLKNKNDELQKLVGIMKKAAKRIMAPEPTATPDTSAEGVLKEDPARTSRANE